MLRYRGSNKDCDRFTKALDWLVEKYDAVRIRPVTETWDENANRYPHYGSRLSKGDLKRWKESVSEGVYFSYDLSIEFNHDADLVEFELRFL